MSVMPRPDDAEGPDRVELPPFDVQSLTGYLDPVAFGSPPAVAVELVGELPWELRDDATDAPVSESGLRTVLRDARLRTYRPEEWEIKAGRGRAYGAEVSHLELANSLLNVSVRVHEQPLGYWISTPVVDGELVIALGRSRRIGGETLPILLAKLAARDFSRTPSGARLTVGRKTFVFDLVVESPRESAQELVE